MPKSRGRKKQQQRRNRIKPGLRASSQDALNSAVARKVELEQETHGEALDVLPAECRIPMAMEPEAAEVLLHRARTSLEQLSRQYVSAMGSYSWLFYLRRLPRDLLSGRLATTAPYLMRLAENLSASSPSADFFPESKGRLMVPRLDSGSADAVIKLCALTGPLGTIHSVLRRAGKGQRVRWFADDMPWVVADTQLDAAIESYDKRVAASSGLAGGTRMLKFYPFFTRYNDRSRSVSEFLLSATVIGRAVKVPAWNGAVAKVTKRRFISPGYVVGGVTLEETSRLYALTGDRGRWNPPGLAGLVLLLRCLFRLTYIADTGVGQSVPVVGYMMIPTAALDEILQDEIEMIRQMGLDPGPAPLPSSAADSLADLWSLQPALWPLEPGPILRPAGDQTVIDILTASLRMERLLTIDNSASSALVNARGGHFELVVQDHIDNSPWRQPDELRALRGRTLRIGGNPVTDIDAVALDQETLVLISCKSIPHTAELDSGAFTKVRNVRTHLEDSDQVWQDKVQTLVNHPRGDNFDLRGYAVRGIVCVPHVEFTMLDQARIVFDDGKYGMRAVCSLNELLAYIYRDSAAK